jgi:hypothetical protein
LVSLTESRTLNLVTVSKKIQNCTINNTLGPACQGEKINYLSAFVKRVREIRYEEWRVPDHQELWFRGEGEKHETSPLRPNLYRPPMGTAMKSIPELLEIECALYDDFRRCGAQLCNERIEEADQDWDWYFLMQHHNAPTRLLYWSDGALIALHLHCGIKQKMRCGTKRRRATAIPLFMCLIQTG